MLTEKLANDIALAAQRKVENLKLGGSGTVAAALGALGLAGAGGYLVNKNISKVTNAINKRIGQLPVTPKKKVTTQNK